MGYRYDPWVRFTPANGLPETWKLSEKFTDTDGPAQCRPSYAQDVTRRTDLNRVRGQRHRGFRPSVRMVCDIWAIEEQANLAILINRLRQPDLWTVELALDAGLTWRPVLIDRIDGPDPLGGKTFVGARYVLELECRSLIDDFPNMTAEPLGVRDFLSDGDLEDWASATNLTSWAENQSNGSTNQDTAVRYSGSSSCRMDRTSASDGSLLITNAGRKLVPGSWYRFSFYYRAGFTAATNGVAWRILNVTQNAGLQADGSWGGIGAMPVAIAATNTWYLFSIEFQVPDSYGAADDYSVELRHHYGANNGQSAWFDLASLKGPIRPTGVHAW